jgi:copper(I)-binding protein
MTTVGAFYMKINNPASQADQLVSARSDACGTVELHTVITNADGMMEMQPVKSIDVPANGSAELKPGGFHVMCIDLKDSFKVGAKIGLTLVFATAGEVNVQADIRDQ